MKIDTVLTVKFIKLLVLGAFLSTAACTPSDDGSKPKKDREAPENRSILEESACGVKPEIGPSGFNSVPREDMQTSYFDKSYDQGQLGELLNLSLNSSIQFVKLQNVNLVRGEATRKASCSPFSQLELADGHAKEEWERVLKAKDGTENVILGLYLEKGKPGVKDLKDKAAIIVRGDTSRWTLVHEYMHHLFTEANQKAGLPTYELKERLNASYDKNYDIIEKLYYEKLDKGEDLTREEAQKLAQAELALIGDLFEIQVRYPLEEVTIESHLIREYSEQDFTAVPDVDVISAAWYVHSKYDSTKKTLNSLRNIMQDTLYRTRYQISVENSNSLEILVKEMKSAAETLEDLNNIALKEAKKRGKNLEEDSGRWNGLLAQAGHAHNCSHSMTTKQIEKLTQKLVNRADN